jgi:hypothetical protein
LPGLSGNERKKNSHFAVATQEKNLTIFRKNGKKIKVFLVLWKYLKAGSFVRDHLSEPQSEDCGKVQPLPDQSYRHIFLPRAETQRAQSPCFTVVTKKVGDVSPKHHVADRQPKRVTLLSDPHTTLLPAN